MPKCKSNTKFLPAAFAWVLLLTCTSLFFAYPGRWYFEENWWLVLVYQGLVTLFVVMNFSLATFMDPGVIPRAKSHEDKYDDFRAPLYKNVEINGITVRMKWCVTCQFYRPPRCSHCSVCNNCIEIFDHHCPWVNNCIGRRNYRYFFMFLISLSVHMTSIFIFSLIHVLKNKQVLDKTDVIVSIVLICVISLLFIPIFGLTGFHMVLVSRGRTTNEQVTGKFRGGYNPFSKNCCFNCCNTLCGPQYPSLKHPTKYVGKKTRKYVIPAKPLTPLHMQTMPNEGGAVQATEVGGGGGATGGAGAANKSSEGQMYRDLSSGGIHGTPYDGMTPMLSGKDGDDVSDMDEPMASQSNDSEAPLTHNTSKGNFFNMETGGAAASDRPGGSGGGQHNPQYVKGSPHQPADAVDGATYQSPMSKKVGKMGGVPTPLAGVVQSPNRFAQQQQQKPEYLQMKEQTPSQQYHHHSYQQQQQQQQPHPSYAADDSHNRQPQLMQIVDPARTQASFDLGHRYHVKSPTKRYMSEGELLDNVNNAPVTTDQQHGSSTVISASHLTDVVSSPQRNYYMWKDQGQETHPSYASQVGYYLQQSQPRIPPQSLNQAQTVIQSGGPRTTPSGYPGGPVVPSGQLSPQHHHNNPARPTSHHGYSTTGRMSVHQQTAGGQQQQPGGGPVSFTRAMEMSKSIGQSLNQHQQAGDGTEMQSVQAGGASGGGGGSGQPGDRDSVYDMNSYEISV